MRARRQIIAGLAGALAVSVLAVPTASSAQQAGASAQLTPFTMVEDRDVNDRLPQPEDRYALASGCYTIEVVGQGWVVADGATGQAPGPLGERAAATPLHFQATDLGTYLLAKNLGPDTQHAGATWDNRSYLSATGGLVATPSTAAEWLVNPASGDAKARNLAGQDYFLTSLADPTLGMHGENGTARADGAPGPIRFHHVADDDPSDDDANGTACANWPEVSTSTSGAPAPTGRGPADRVEGFFEAHIHGMAFEFLGGAARCGSPWHRYGVEFALPDCQAAGRSTAQVLETGAGGAGPGDAFGPYDPVGWPTFNYWPRNDLLVYEQFYYKWLERAHHGGLRIFTNLFVENQVLCEVFPQKQNSCNEMDSVRLQAIRIHELQDYIDAQSGGPGEGWFRIVTDPSQARRVINDGRLAVVLGIEVSTLFDCGEILDVPQCTADQIDERLAEAFDMGVRQMELLNKFDSALAGVTGDGGSTGVIVNQGNRRLTQHYWNMVSCEEIDPSPYEGHEHDKAQPNFVDETFGGNNAEVDQLAGLILNQFGNLGGLGAPAYPPAPHCNTRGFTALGEHVLRGMFERGMIMDPDHMSALSQREMLDFIENVLIPEEAAAAKAEGRKAVTPSIISSHSWGNDVIYQRILKNDGHVAPRTNRAETFVEYWAERRAWWEQYAPPGAIFGMGYGADTNGLGGQPGPRDNPKVPVNYATGWQAPIGDVTIFQQQSGVKTYDIADGVSHYGLFADWFQELRLAAEEKVGPGAGDRIIQDMLNGAEDYLRMWERNVYGANECVEDGSFLQVEDVHALVGQNFEGYQRAIGSPAGRSGPVYTYCTENGIVDVIFDAAGNAIEVVDSVSGLGLLPQEEEPEPAPEPSPDPAPEPDAEADHAHAPLPATGGGATAAAFLAGLSALGVGGLRRRR